MTLAHEIKLEHEEIERELLELQTVINSSFINYPNLLHVTKKLKSIWEAHEEKEEPFFQELFKKGFTIPIKKITFEHGKLNQDLNKIISALQTKKEDEIHTVLFKYGNDLIKNLRQHMADEDWILYALPKKFF